MSETLDRLYDLEVSPSEFREALRDVVRRMPRKRRAVSLWLRDKDAKLVIDAGEAGGLPGERQNAIRLEAPGLRCGNNDADTGLGQMNLEATPISKVDVQRTVDRLSPQPA